MNTAMVILLCLLLGTVAAILWPHRHTARVFLVVAVITGAIVALVNSWKRSAKR